MNTNTRIEFKRWQILPPLSLTPALSRRERENRVQSPDETEPGDSRMILEQTRNTRLLFPLPQGEGQGEGEFRANAPTKTISQQP